MNEEHVSELKRLSLPSHGFNPSRRRFLRNVGLIAGTGFSLGVMLPGCGDRQAGSATQANEFQPSIWLRITPDNRVLIRVAEVEMGQGVLTSLPMLIAEELDAAWHQIEIEQAPLDPRFGYRATGWSSSIRDAWLPLRQAGATARQALLEAAAVTWGVSPADCTTAEGVVVHAASGRHGLYGEWVGTARDRPLPIRVQLKQPGQFRLLGTSPRRTDVADKVTGAARYGMDVQLPGMLVALIARAPVLGARLKGFDATAASSLPGVKKIFAVGSGVAVVASGFWEARRAQDALILDWQHDPATAPDSRRMSKLFADSVDLAAEVVDQRGNGFLAEPAGLGTVVEATYELPLQAHATLEPMNCCAWFHDGRCELWAPTQTPSGARECALDELLSRPERLWRQLESRLTGQFADQIQLHPTLIGGGFGRRLNTDYVVDAVQVARQVQAPVKVIWSREDDFRHDYFRPASLQRLRATIAGDGSPLTWHHRLISTRGSTEGADDLPYAVPRLVVDKVVVDVAGLRTGSWRSVAHSYTVFAIESFVDELAFAAGADPWQYRRRLLGHSPRHLKALDAAAETAGWSQPPGNGRYLGVAVHRAFGTYVAQVVEVTPDGSRVPRVVRVVCAIDCGQVVHPDTVVAQVEGSIIFALTAALKSAITLRDGVVEQTNFGRFQLLRMDETPTIDVVLLPSGDAPGGVGEPAVPPLAPALANALFAATGKRYRRLPVSFEPTGPSTANQG